MNKKTVRDIDVKGKKVLVRCDFNVPQDENEATQIVEHTVPHLQHANNAVILGYCLIKSFSI